MAEVIRGSYKDIADAIRAKKGTSNEMTPAEMPAEIGSIIKPTGTKSITENGEGIDVTAYAAVDVDVQGGGGLEAPATSGLYYWWDERPVELTSESSLEGLDVEPGHSRQIFCYIDISAYNTHNPPSINVYTYDTTSGYVQAMGSGSAPEPANFDSDKYYKGSGSSLDTMDWSSGYIYVFGDEDMNVAVEEELPSDVGDSKTFEYDNKTFTITRTE